jgi:4-hydroxythreonine-4-phosphate dehydrogenase
LSAISRPPKVLAFTSGDPAGVGPRASLAAVRAKALPRGVTPLFVGEKAVWARAGWRASDGPLFETRLGVLQPKPGKVSAAGGKISAASFEAALSLCARGQAGGMVTAPISKEAWAAAGYNFRDHTERLADFTGRPADMVLGIPSKNLWCALATRHMSLSEAVRSATPARVTAAAKSLRAALSALGVSRPRLALCALNPHAGENGLFGSEEQALGAVAKKIGIHGPLPADSAWRLHVEGVYDGLVCLYHDQALIPLKALGGLSGVNWTVGIPFVRTSPAHGTGWDAARIDASATIEAARLAARQVLAK